MTRTSTESVAALHSETRGAKSVVQLLVMGGLVAVLPVIPGVGEALGVGVFDTTLAMALFVVAMVHATVAYHVKGFTSRWYWHADWIETWVTSGAILYLVYASGSAVSGFWIFYLLHSFFAAASHTSQHVLQRIAYGVGPAVLGAAFLAGGGTFADAVICVVVGVCGLWLVLLLSRTSRRMQELVDENLRLAAELASERVREERARIGRDLHDGIGAAMTSILWQARELEVSPDPTTRARASELCEHVTASIDELRGIVATFRARARPWPDFVDELSRKCRAVARVDTVVESDTDDPDRVLAGPYASECILAALEMVRNADNHAAATRIKLRIEAAERFRIVVEDNGKGFDAHEVAVSDGGLANLHARAKALGGNLVVQPHAPGTRIELEFPMPQSA